MTCRQQIAIIVMTMLCITGCGANSQNKLQSAKSESIAKSDSKSIQKPQVTKSVQPTVVTPKVDMSDANKPTWDPQGVADFTLTERSGRKVKRADLLGKPWVACFIFTHCAGPCSAISGEMYQLQEWLKSNKIDDVTLVTITVDPKRDTPEVMERYSKNFGADKDRWLFLTGDETVLYTLIKTSFGQPVKQQTGEDRKPGFEVLHTSAVMLVDATGKVVEEYNGKYPTEMLKLRDRLRLWKKSGSFEKPDNKSPKSGGQS